MQRAGATKKKGASTWKIPAKSRWTRCSIRRQIEGKLYREWEENGYFVAHRDPNKKPFTIVMPPPNITGQLHMGHAMDGVMQDALTRYHRMLGEATLWLPGTDHASIATEVKVVEKLREEGLTKEQIGREAFLERVWDWKREYGGRIARQTRRLGASCDWSRERFTWTRAAAAR